MSLSILQIALIGLTLFAVCVNIYKDGQPDRDWETHLEHHA